MGGSGERGRLEAMEKRGKCDVTPLRAGKVMKVVTYMKPAEPASR